MKEKATKKLKKVTGACTKWQPFQMASFETFRKELDLLKEARYI